MLLTEKTFIFSNLTSYLSVKTYGHKPVNVSVSVTTLAKKRDFSESSGTQKQKIFPINVSNTILPRAAIAVLGLGFIDAGYSGDWSRIGVISKETEALLKAAAFVVIPLCIFLIFSLSKESEA